MEIKYAIPGTHPDSDFPPMLQRYARKWKYDDNIIWLSLNYSSLSVSLWLLRCFTKIQQTRFGLRRNRSWLGVAWNFYDIKSFSALRTSLNLKDAFVAIKNFSPSRSFHELSISKLFTPIFSRWHLDQDLS